LELCYSCSGDKANTNCDVAVPVLGACRGYRLPTEAEWEFAARAGTVTATFAGRLSTCMSDDEVANRVAWYKASSKGRSHPVATREANPFGLFDMTGNVFEWTANWYGELVAGRDPTGPESGSERVMRGGSWYHNAEHLRSANRLAVRPNQRLSYAGVRCARTTDPTPDAP
jgi:formylglycine-generating enzyme required for sulfatase activity